MKAVEGSDQCIYLEGDEIKLDLPMEETKITNGQWTIQPLIDPVVSWWMI